MSNTRGRGQKLIPVPADEKFIQELNAGFRKAGFANRSQFIRDAIVEKLERMGIAVSKKHAVAPVRIGKGGRQSPPAAAKTGGVKQIPAKKTKLAKKKH